MDDNGERWVSIGVASSHFGISVDTLRNWAEDLDLPPAAVTRTRGGHRRFHLGQIEAWLREASWMNDAFPTGEKG